MEVKAHAEQMSDGMGLINATGTKAPDIEFLERHHIGLASGDHLGDPLWGLLVRLRADVPVDIESYDAQQSWPCTLVPRRSSGFQQAPLNPCCGILAAFGGASHRGQI